MISFKQRGDFSNTEKFFKTVESEEYLSGLDLLGMEGVRALSSATPKRTGKTASSWDYEIVKEDGKTSIVWHNSNVNRGVNIAVILDTGHGTRKGGYVVGRNYIEPAIMPIFDKITEEAWREVTK